jgi:hypothetical protein
MKKIISIILTLVIIMSATSVTAFAIDTDSYEYKLSKLCGKIDLVINNVGGVPPYYSWGDLYRERLKAADLYNDSSITEDDFKEEYEKLSYIYNNMIIDPDYAKATYVLSLEEHNNNGWYDESDWNDFVEKREALRVSFKTEDYAVISDAFCALNDSFINMTSKYSLLFDVDKDGKVTIMDATYVQKALAGLTDNLNGAQRLLLSEKNGAYSYGYTVSIEDVTKIQKYLAELIECEQNNSEDWYKRFVFTTDYGDEINFVICIANEFYDSRIDMVNAKIQELESQGII